MKKRVNGLTRLLAMVVCLALLLSTTAFAAQGAEEGEPPVAVQTDVPAPSQDPDPSDAPAAFALTEPFSLLDFKVMDGQGNVVGQVKKGDTITIEMKVKDPAAAGKLGASVVDANIVCTAFTGSVGVLKVDDDAQGIYTLKFENVRFNGGSNMLAVNVSYKGTNIPFITIEQEVRQCVLTEPAPTPDPTAAPTASGAYITAYCLTDAGGAERIRVEKGERTHVVLSVADPAIKGTDLEAKHIAARVNTPAFTFTGLAEVSKVDTDAGSYVLLFRDVIFNGGDNVFNVDISYVGTTLAQGNVTHAFAQCVTTTENSRTPTLLVRGSTVTSSVEGAPAGSALAGSQCALNLELLTTSGDEDLTDLLVTLSLPEGITLASGNTTAYLASMAAGGTTNMTFQLLPSATYTGGVATVGVSLSAVGRTSGTTVSSSTSVTLPVVQPERFELTNLEAPEMMYLGEEGYVSLIFVNKGKSAINNLSAEIKGDNLANPGQSQYLGNIAAGTENSVDFNIMGQNAGPMTVTILLTYEDAQGQLKTMEKQFSCDVQEMPVFEDPMMGDMGMGMEMPIEEEESGLPGWAKVLIGLAVAGAAVGGGLFIRKKRQAKALQTLEDEDEDL